MLPGLVRINTRSHLVIVSSPSQSTSPSTCSPTGTPNFQEHHVHVLGLGYVVAASHVLNDADLEHPQRKLTSRGFTHPQL
ncbi:hypothetical protein D9611_004342 [Ephemerocybe angulata]|uniref:Uncharacterized protein n=1 Tax=Ephemerocybe angulata TaxID=980116 RepID=A0A8H5BK29_9AGAR|nr:hypothetical protein D9611_004342 [Tulosesus angulatus]